MLYEHFLSVSKADHLLHNLIAQTPWEQPVLSMFGKQVSSPRLAAWYGDRDAVYCYSGLVNHPLPWTPTLHDVRNNLQSETGVRFNSVLLNLYRDGNDSMGWHADDEPELGETPVIASLSLGATRRFLMRRKQRISKQREPARAIELAHGSLLVMQGSTQQYWQHRVSPTKIHVGPRINLTFRVINPQGT